MKIKHELLLGDCEYELKGIFFAMLRVRYLQRSLIK